MIEIPAVLLTLNSLMSSCTTDWNRQVTSSSAVSGQLKRSSNLLGAPKDKEMMVMSRCFPLCAKWGRVTLSHSNCSNKHMFEHVNNTMKNHQSLYSIQKFILPMYAGCFSSAQLWFLGTGTGHPYATWQKRCHRRGSGCSSPWTLQFVMDGFWNAIEFRFFKSHIFATPFMIKFY